MTVHSWNHQKHLPISYKSRARLKLDRKTRFVQTPTLDFQHSLNFSDLHRHCDHQPVNGAGGALFPYSSLASTDSCVAGRNTIEVSGCVRADTATLGYDRYMIDMIDDVSTIYSTRQRSNVKLLSMFHRLVRKLDS
jgi:hypothetical protein